MVANVRNRVNSFFINGHERSLIAKKNIILSFLIKGGGIMIGLILIPMTINYVSAVQYGIWLTISSIIGWLNFFDVGLGNGLRNKLTHSLARNEIENAKTYISTTYASLAVIALSVFVLFSIANQYISWTSLLNVKSENEYTLRLVMWVAVGCFCSQFVIQLINTVLTATHRAANASLISFLGQLSTLAAIYYCTLNIKGNLNILVTIVASVPVIILIISSYLLYNKKLKNFCPNYKSINFKYAKELLTTGSKFFYIQLGALVLFQTNYIIISQVLGPEQVSVFSICYKLFSVTIMIFTIIMTPLWSSFTDAYVKEDYRWLKNSIQKMRKLFIFFVLITAGILLLSPYIFKYWIGEQIKIPFSLSAIMAVYAIAYIWQMLHVFLLNGIGKIHLQLILITISALINIPLTIVLGKKFGLEGIVSANTILFIIMGTLFSIQCEKIIFQRALNIWNR